MSQPDNVHCASLSDPVFAAALAKRVESGLMSPVFDIALAKHVVSELIDSSVSFYQARTAGECNVVFRAPVLAPNNRALGSASQS